MSTMSKSRQEVLEESRRKGTVAGVAAVATVARCGFGFWNGENGAVEIAEPTASASTVEFSRRSSAAPASGVIVPARICRATAARMSKSHAA